MNPDSESPEWKLKGVLDAAYEADYQWQRFVSARSPLAQASALVELSNAMFNLRTWQPSFDSETDTLDWEREDEENA